MSYEKPSSRNRSRLSTRVRTGVAVVAACFVASPAFSNPLNPAVVSGTATFNQAGSVLTVTNSNGAIINWDKFSIQAGETTHFAQAAASSTVLNRVLNDPTVIYGTLSSNGQVWLVNPAGIMVGPGGLIDTAGFVASTLAIRNEDFLAGRRLFANDGSAQNVINQGEIRTPSGGSVYLVGSNVANEGIITTPQGETILAAGATVSLIDSATPGVKVDITGAAGNATNLGTITAEAGRIGIAGVIVRNSGTLNASSVVSEGGRIFLKASQDAYVDGNGRIVTTGTRGGSVEVLGNRVAVMDNAVIDASGTSGGGSILVGGDYQGSNPAIQNASITYFGPNASLKADATEVGDGGTAIVWADDTTRAYGSISARGGASGGNGGFVETSGKQYLDVAGIKVSTEAANGMAGTWLLDPTDVTIVHSGTSGGVVFYGGIFDNGGGSTTTLTDFDINANLGSNDITITTSSAGYGTGDIMFDGAAGGAIVITNGTATARTLTLSADNDIKFYGGTTTFNTTGTGSFGINFNPAANRKVEVQSGATVTFAGASPSAVVAAYMGGTASGRSWDNFGTINLNGTSYIDLYSSAYSALNNKSTGVVNVNSTQGWPIQSESGAQAGQITNDGVFNVNGTYGALEAEYNQGAGGTLNLAANAILSMQNAGTIYGGVNIGANGRLVISEVHGGARTFYNASISGPGMLDLAQSTSFVGSTMSNGILARSNGVLGVPGSGLTFSGDMTFASVADVMFGPGTYNFGSLTVLAGWDGSGFTSTDIVPGAGNLAAAGDISMYADRNISINGGLASYGGNILLGAGGNLNYFGGSVNTFGGSLTLGAGGILDFNTTGGFSSVGALSFAAPVINLHGGGGAYGIWATGDVSLNAQQLTIGNFDYTGISSDTSVTVKADSLTMRTGGLFAASNIDITAGSINGSRDSLISAGNNITATVAGDIRWNDFSHMLAYNDIFLTLAGAASTLYLNGTPGLPASTIETYAPNTVYLTFLSRNSGGVVLDGEATTSSVIGRSGFFANGLPATEGAGLVLAYAPIIVNNTVTNDIGTALGGATTSGTPIDPAPEFISEPDRFQSLLDPNATTGGTEDTFGGDENAEKSTDKAKDETKSEKKSEKKYSQCT